MNPWGRCASRRSALHVSAKPGPIVDVTWDESGVTQGFALFDTAIGTCALAWGPRGLVGASLPSKSAATSRTFMRKRFPDAVESEPPADVQIVIGDILALLQGEKRDFKTAKLDLEAIPAFHRRVYDIARAIPPGEVLTYGDVAKRLGDASAARAVGQALGANPFPIIIPCHRVLATGGKTGGFSAPLGLETKMKMLTIERAKLDDKPSLFNDLPLAAKPRRQT
ncbi:MAG: methylated-DNA--[protein]-cysteine S-methyltransferase [Alphaproteobacteria bacterium]|nr:methylated-DNA--[protein]-cysteine S-methyltransferase [Alphaproteobacteria bacterium]